MEEKGEENEKVVGMGNGSGSSTSKIIHLNIPVDEPSGTDGSLCQLSNYLFIY